MPVELRRQVDGGAHAEPLVLDGAASRLAIEGESLAVGIEASVEL
jgi:hypothetical protein